MADAITHLCPITLGGTKAIKACHAEDSMNESVKDSLEEIDRRFAASEKRFDDLKWYLGGMAAFFTIWFGVLTLVLSWNNNSERESLRQFQQNLREDLGKSEATPQVELLGDDGQQLTGQDVVAAFKIENMQPHIVISHVLKNAGSGPTGPMTVKIYTSGQLELERRSTDEPRYQYEVVISDLDPSELPGGLSSGWYHSIRLPQEELPPPGKYPSLVKIYYGKGKMTQAQFNLIVPQDRRIQ
jgi:hypothetical protein